MADVSNVGYRTHAGPSRNFCSLFSGKNSPSHRPLPQRIQAFIPSAGQPSQTRAYIAEQYSIADIANYAWIRSYYWARVDIEGLHNLQDWMARMAAKPGIQRGCEIPQGAKNAQALARGGASITTT